MNTEKQNCDCINNKCSCMGANLDKFVQPAILTAVRREQLTAYQITQRLANYSMFAGASPDITGIYRIVKQMEQKGYLSKSVQENAAGKDITIYALTDTGSACLKNWIETLENYREAIASLLKEMQQ